MSIDISPESAEKIRALCRTISVAHDLDEEIHLELYAHMEDKFLGYISGDERLSEEDAFILVRNHFSDPESVRDFPHETHDEKKNIYFFRLLGAVTAAYLATGVLCWIYVLFLEVFMSAGLKISNTMIHILALAYMSVSMFLPPAVLFFWRSRTENRRRIWYDSLNPLPFLFIIVFLFSMLALPVSFHLKGNAWSRIIQSLDVGNWVLMPPIFQCLVWLWWFDGNPRRYRVMLYGLFAWMAYNAVTLFILHMDEFQQDFTKPFIYLEMAVLSAILAVVAAVLYVLFNAVRAMRNRTANSVSH